MSNLKTLSPLNCELNFLFFRLYLCRFHSNLDIKLLKTPVSYQFIILSLHIDKLMRKIICDRSSILLFNLISRSPYFLSCRTLFLY